MSSQCRFLLCGILCACAVAVPSRSRAEDQPPAAAIDSQAQKVVDAWGKYLKGQEGFEVSIKVTVEIEQNGQTKEVELLQQLLAERPNELLFTQKSPAGEGTAASITCNGKELSIYIKSLGKYMAEEAPETWEGIFRNQMAAGIISSGNAAIVISALVADDPAAKLFEGVQSAKYGGIADLDDVKCHLISVTGKDLDWQMWIDAGEKPLVRQFVPDLGKYLAKIGRGNAALANMKISNVVRYNDWQVNPTFAKDAFEFTVPDDAVKADSLADILGGRRGAEAPHPLLAKAAPAIKLDLLGGGKLDLAALRGKNVVILDFWATWCGPCQQAMPIIEKVADEYKKKGVLLYAVNIEENAEDVQKFVDDSKLRVAVALDRDGAVARPYEANAIPQTVLVGKDGTVQVVHVGLSPELERELKKELDALVAGKDLAADAKAKADHGKAAPDEQKN